MTLATPAEAALGLALATLLTELDAPAARRRAHRRQIYCYIERHLGDARLSPQSIAAAHHISLRQLYKLFAEEQQPVAEWIRTRRLQHCRRDLADPTLADRPVAAIAARWGFASATHFNRLFKHAYGMPPGQYRLMHAQHTAARHLLQLLV
ncbi:helix-turn-helix domain-containing protein [Nonomuraea sp. NBC_00507]|uniref:helix-turn-helix domain-containing protein n=1 Tax=Nonomuraea sp. NBC_00507 TaxID=2976002 RepID=UPI002E180024